MSRLVLFLVVIALALAFTNPSEADFREHIRQKDGIAGQFGMAMADILSGGKKGGISRENFLIGSRFYIGGDGVLPRKNVAWGIARQFIEIKDEDERVPAHR